MRLGAGAVVAMVMFVACGSQEEAPSGAPAVAPDYADCGGSFRLGPGFDDEQRAGVEIAMRRWNEWAGREYFALSPEGACPILALDIESGSAAVSYNVDTGRIRMDLTRLKGLKMDRGPEFEGSVMHELGHSIGMRDLGVEAIMGPTGLDFTDADLAECRRVEFCP